MPRIYILRTGERERRVASGGGFVWPGYGGTLGYRAPMCLGFFGSISDIGMA